MLTGVGLCLCSGWPMDVVHPFFLYLSCLLSFRVCSFLFVALGAASQNPAGHSSDAGMDMGTKWGLWGIFRPPTAAGLPAIFLPPLPLRSLLLG